MRIILEKLTPLEFNNSLACLEDLNISKYIHTLESPLDWKEIQSFSPKGNQSWISIGRTDAEAEVLILWPSDMKNWLIRKDPDAEKDWRLEEKGTTSDEMVGWHHWLHGRVWAISRSWWWTQKPGVLQSMGSQRVRHDWATELNWGRWKHFVKQAHWGWGGHSRQS